MSDRLEHDELVRLYGPWRPRTPADVAALFAGFSGTWWVAGGWAIETFTGRSRSHGDIDPSIARSDLPALRAYLAGRMDVWSADQGTLRPLVDERDALPETCGNLWLRHSGSDPWEYDVLLTDFDAGKWAYKRDRSITLPASELLWERDGISYLRPEVQLLHKAPGLRPQDQQDFDACLPRLSEAAAAWLRSALERAHPGHPWIHALALTPPRAPRSG